MKETERLKGEEQAWLRTTGPQEQHRGEFPGSSFHLIWPILGTGQVDNPEIPMSSKQKRYLQKSLLSPAKEDKRGSLKRFKTKQKNLNNTCLTPVKHHRKPPPQQCRCHIRKLDFHPTQQNQSIPLLPTLGIHQRRTSGKSGLPPPPAVTRHPCPSWPGHHLLRPSARVELPHSMSSNMEPSPTEYQQRPRGDSELQPQTGINKGQLPLLAGAIS